MSLLDARHLADGEIEADVAIVGAGAAGIALATELANDALRVVVAEAGDIGHRHLSQFCYLGENIGRRNISTIFSRFRRFGGSTTRWGGQCRPLDTDDFEPRAYIADSGWPVSSADLHDAYARAQRFLQLGPFDYEPQRWLGESISPLRLDAGGRLQTRIYQFAYPTDMGVAHREVLEQAGNVRVLLNASLVRMHTDAEAARIEGLDLATPRGGGLRVRARHYVLACGGIENARLLLACNERRPNGLGNDHDLVGRYFMDHPYVFPGWYEPARGAGTLAPYVIEGYEQVGRQQRFHAALTLSDALRREEGLCGASLYLLRRPRHKAEAAYSSPGGVAINHLIEVLQHREHPDGRLRSDLAAALRDAPNALRALIGRLRSARPSDQVAALRVALETTPCRASRVTLGPKRDRHGLARVRVDWRLNDADLHGYDRLLQVLREELAARGAGRLVEHGLRDADGWPAGMLGGKHHMGTTRMHADPRQGVVDAHCRVHGVENLHVAGSSVFVTGGYANPTLTLVALSMRLADRLKSLLGRQVRAA